MAPLPTELVRDAHPYTHNDMPWRMEEDRSVDNTVLSDGRRLGWRFFHYLGGGGLKDFFLTDEEFRIIRRRNRFLVIFAFIFTAWFLLLVF